MIPHRNPCTKAARDRRKFHFDLAGRQPHHRHPRHFRVVLVASPIFSLNTQCMLHLSVGDRRQTWKCRAGGRFVDWSDQMQFLRVSAMLSLLAATPCSANCHTDYYRYYHGSEVSTTMHVSSGAPCVITFTLGGKMSIYSIAITEQAKHGAASWNGSKAYPEVTYRSSRGYSGQDQFLYSIFGPSDISDRPAVVRVSVVVK